jgi:hypothetical protein
VEKVVLPKDFGRERGLAVRVGLEDFLCSECAKAGAGDATASGSRHPNEVTAVTDSAVAAIYPEVAVKKEEVL